MPEELEQHVDESAAPVEEQVETPSESATDETEPNPAAKEESAYQKRINQLTRQKNDAARDAEYWRQQALKPRETPAAQTEPAKTDEEPKEEDFEGNAAGYVRAVARYEAKQELIQANKAEEERNAKRTREQQEADQQKRINADLKQFKTATPDFDDVLEAASFNTSPLLNSELREADSPAALLYFLAKNPDEANRIADIQDAKRVAKEVAKIEARIASSAPAKQQESTTSTPAPIKPVPASRATIARTSTNDAEYFAKEREAGRMR